jgi:hypothetical protein
MAPFAQKRMLAHLKPDEKHPGGRPSEYDPAFCTMVEDYMAKGYSLTAFAGSIRKGRETVYGWMSAHREFSDAVSRGRAARTAALETKLLAARYGAQCSAAIFALKNAQPDEWRDLKHVETVNTQLVQLSDAQLMAIAAGMQGDLTGDVVDGTCERIEPQQPDER